MTSLRHHRRLALFVVLYIIGLAFLLHHNVVLSPIPSSHNDTDDSATTSTALKNDNATTILPWKTFSTEDSSSSSIFIPDSPHETNLTALADSVVVIVNALEGGGSAMSSSSPFASCQPTAQVQIITTTQPFWTLQTFDADGRAKLVGGDEFYIVYRRTNNNDGRVEKITANDEEQQYRDPTAVALIQDNGDGSFTLDFVTTPMQPNLPAAMTGADGDDKDDKGFGNLTVYFDYTCHIGSLAPPFKKHWKNNGSTNVVHTRSIPYEPPIRRFQHAPRPDNISSLSSDDFDMVHFIGASTMKSIVQGPNGKPFQKNTYIQNNFRSPLNTSTVEQFWQVNRPDLLLMHDNTHTIAVIMGSDIWDILSNDPNQGPGFEDHLTACARVVELGRRLYPNATLMWKSPTAMHILRLPRDCTDYMCQERVRYMSATRTKFLYEAQKALMKTLQIPFWDIYHATYLSAFRTRPGDGRHYHRPFNKMISNYLFDKHDDSHS